MAETRKILVYGGSFDPPHAGHIELLKSAAAYLRPDEVRVFPAFLSPLKEASRTAPELRMKLISAALAEAAVPAVTDDFEIKRGKKTYTYQVLRYLAGLEPDAKLYLLVGSDCLPDFHLWKNHEEILRRCTLLVGTRPGFTATEHFRGKYEFQLLPGIFPLAASNELRRELAITGIIPNTVSPSAAELIRRENRYGLDMHKWLAENLRPERYQHSKNVARLAGELAVIYKAPPLKAITAGLLHDAGKGIKDITGYCALHGIKPEGFEEISKNAPALLHSFASAHMAKTMFGVHDAETLAAIAKHTLGAARMTTLDKILYVADISSYERPFAEAALIRQTAQTDLDAALLSAARTKLFWVVKNDKWLCPQGIKIWNKITAQQKA